MESEAGDFSTTCHYSFAAVSSRCPFGIRGVKLLGTLIWMFQLTLLNFEQSVAKFAAAEEQRIAVLNSKHREEHVLAAESWPAIILPQLFVDKPASSADITLTSNMMTSCPSRSEWETKVGHSSAGDAGLGNAWSEIVKLLRQALAMRTDGEVKAVVSKSSAPWMAKVYKAIDESLCELSFGSWVKLFQAPMKKHLAQYDEATIDDMDNRIVMLQRNFAALGEDINAKALAFPVTSSTYQNISLANARLIPAYTSAYKSFYELVDIAQKSVQLPAVADASKSPLAFALISLAQAAKGTNTRLQVACADVAQTIAVSNLTAAKAKLLKANFLTMSKCLSQLYGQDWVLTVAELFKQPLGRLQDAQKQLKHIIKKQT